MTNFARYKTMEIMYKTDNDEQQLQITTLGCCESLATTMPNCLFNLPLTHPTIDYVGFFKVNGISWLIFFQISLIV